MGTNNRIAPTVKTKSNKIYCRKNKRWYTSKARMLSSLADSKRKSKKKYCKGRKVRNVDPGPLQGKMYSNWAVLKRSVDFSLVQKKNIANTEFLDKIRPDSYTKKALLKRKASWKRFLDKNPQFRVDAKERIVNNPELMEFYRKNIENVPGMRGWSTDPENAAILVHKLKTHRNGKQVIEIIECQREKTQGVVYG